MKNTCYIKIKRNRKGEYYALLISRPNGKVIWRTSESYKRMRGVERAIELLRSYK